MEKVQQQRLDLHALAISTALGYQYDSKKKKKLAIPPQHILSPINLAEQTCGAMSIHHRIVKDSTPIIGARQALMRGVRQVRLKLKQPLIVHQLVEDPDEEEGYSGVWMTDLPEELFQIAEAIASVKPQGHVLVGGLGLGILAKMLVALPEVKSVTVVELSKDVISLCAAPGYAVIHGNIHQFLSSRFLSSRKEHDYDCFMLDTWAGTNESTWWTEVFPMRRMIRNNWSNKAKIWCWAEDIMQGQVARVLAGPGRHWLYEQLPPSMSQKEIKFFLTNIGSPLWEKRYGALIQGEEA